MSQTTAPELPGSKDLQQLIATMSPVLNPKKYTYLTIPPGKPIPDVNAISTFQEVEGLTLVLEYDEAVKAGLEPVGEWAMVTLNVHSSLDAVGFMAAISKTLAANSISANVMAGFYHDHVFLQWPLRHVAVTALEELAKSAAGAN